MGPAGQLRERSGLDRLDRRDLAVNNADPKPFVWHASAQAILDQLATCKQGYLRDTTLVKNANYWKEGVPYLDGVKYFIITDNNTIMAA